MLQLRRLLQWLTYWLLVALVTAQRAASRWLPPRLPLLLLLFPRDDDDRGSADRRAANASSPSSLAARHVALVVEDDWPGAAHVAWLLFRAGVRRVTVYDAASDAPPRVEALDGGKRVLTTVGRGSGRARIVSAAQRYAAAQAAGGVGAASLGTPPPPLEDILGSDARGPWRRERPQQQQQQPLHGAASSEPELLLTFGQGACFSLLGFPPDQLRLTHLHRVASCREPSRMTMSGVRAALAEYGRTERRLGR